MLVPVTGYLQVGWTPYVLVPAWQWIIAVFFYKRVQKEAGEDEAAGWHYKSGQIRRAEIVLKITQSTRIPT